MKKTSIALLTLAAGFMAASCNKEVAPSGHMTINATAEGISTPTKTEMGYRYDIFWSDADQIYVTDGNASDTFTLIEGAGTTKGTFEQNGTAALEGEVEAFYPHNIVDGEALVWPAYQVSNETVPMYCKKSVTGKNEDFNFTSLGSVLQIVLSSRTDATLSKIILSDKEKALSGEFTVVDGKAVIASEATGGIELDTGSKAIGGAARYFNIAVPSGKYSNLMLEFLTTDGKAATMTSTTMPEIEHNTVAMISLCISEFRVIPQAVTLSESEKELLITQNFTLSATVTPENAENKNVIWSSSDETVATVDQTGKVSAVSGGTATITVTTEDHSRTASCTVTVTPSIPGKFTVGTNGKQVRFSQGNLYHDGNSFEFEPNQYDCPASWNANHVGHFLWSSKTSVALATIYDDPGRKNDDVFFTNATEQTAKPDFTVNGIAGRYRTLAMTEWKYLFESRDKAASLYKVGVSVCGKENCLVIAPDNYSSTLKSSYSSEEWSAAEAEGLVCLPAAGYRYDTELDELDSGYYWSSAPWEYYRAQDIIFSDKLSYYDNIRNYGCFVRLVEDAE